MKKMAAMKRRAMKEAAPKAMKKMAAMKRRAMKEAAPKAMKKMAAMKRSAMKAAAPKAMKKMAAMKRRAKGCSGQEGDEEEGSDEAPRHKGGGTKGHEVGSECDKAITYAAMKVV